MARLTQLFQKIPWTGGVDTSVDSGVMSPNNLIQADNVVFTTSGSRLKRDGFDYFDTELPAVTHRISSGTTRKLVFATTLLPTDDSLAVVGENFTVSGAGNGGYNNANCVVSAISTTTNTNDTLEYTFSGAGSLTESSTADTGITIYRNYDILGIIDFWWFDSSNDVKVQELVGVTSQGLIFKYDENGKRTQIAKSGSGATSLSGTITSCDLRGFNNKLIITLSGVGNTPKYYDPATADEWKDLTGSPPDASIMQEHLGRLFMNDKTNPDLLHFSETFDETKWQGVGDSGAIPISEGDGDPDGIKVIFPPFKGRLIVHKGQRNFQIIGDAPETFVIEPISTGVGAISHRAAVAVDMDDVLYFSRRGIHSIIATDQFGDFAGRYVSRDIQPTFNTWNKGQLSAVQGTYVPNINSIAWIVTEDGQTKPNAIWLFNPTIQKDNNESGVWFRWPNINAQSITTRLTSGKFRIACGTNKGRIIQGQNELYSDFETNAIGYRIKSGTIYVDGNPQTIKAYKKFGLLFRPRGRFSFTAYFKVDSLPIQALSFAQTTDGDLLGSEFSLGTSILGSTAIMAPVMKDVVGYGRGFTIEIFQTGLDAQVEIYGYMVEYELADIADEVQQYS